jgi:RHS repeat-associated protein
LLAALNSSISNETGTGTANPQAYLNWVLLDNQFNYVGGNNQSAALQVAGAGTISNGQLRKLVNLGLPITKSGYLYIYVSNATPGWDVFFDNLSVTHYSGAMLEENHYYPFGLLMSGISDKALKTQYAENKVKFDGGVEIQNKEFSDGSGLELYETTFRGYDPQIGRFWQTDPLADLSEDLSPYAFANNNPILYNDPFGLLSDSSHPQVLPTVTVTPGRPAPHVSVNVSLAVIVSKGSDPAASTVAPSTVSPLRNEKFEFEKKWVKGSIAYDLAHTVVEKSSWWDRLNDIGNQGTNIFGERVGPVFHGGLADPLGAGPGGGGGFKALFKLRDVREWEALFEWGHQWSVLDKLKAVSTLYVQRLKSAGVTLEQMKMWADAYGKAMIQERGTYNVIAHYRLELINKLISLW